MSRARREFLRELRAIQYRTGREVRHEEGILRVHPDSEGALAGHAAASQRMAAWQLIADAAERADGADFAVALAAALREPEAP